MIDIGKISIVHLQLEDSLSLNEMLLKNKVRFQRYFPITLAENINLKKTKEYIKNKQSLINSKKEFSLGIKEKKWDKIIGLIILKNINWEIKEAEVAYCLDEHYEGQGLMSEIVDHLSKFAHQNLGLESLFILAHKTNISSIRVAENTGFLWKKSLFKSHTPPNEEPLDMELLVKKL